MMTATSIAHAMTNQDATNGWDAAYGMNLRQVNDLFLQYYLQGGPGQLAVRLRVVLSVQSAFWILEAELGPPKVAFRRDSQTAMLEMEIISGALIAFDPARQIVQSVGRLRPMESRLQGPLVLQQTAGRVNEVGNVVADLGASAYTPAITGVDPKSVLQTDIGLAVQTYFAAAKTSYPLGAILVGDISKPLRPTSFRFWVQQKPASEDACVLLLIRTDGQPGTVGPLPSYPIPDSHSACLIVSKSVIGRLLVEKLSSAFGSLQWKFEYRPAAGSWQVVSTSGALDFGQFGNEGRNDGDFWSSDGQANPQPVRVPCAGFTVAPAEGSLKADWHPRHDQNWSLFREWTDAMSDYHANTFVLRSTIAPSFRQAGPLSVDPVTAKVTFTGRPDFSVNAEGDPDFFQQIFERRRAVPDGIVEKLRNALEPPFHDFHLPEINALALGSLLFPSQHAVSLTEAKLPGDLYLTGALVPTIAVTPVDAAVTPGNTVQFTAVSHSEKDILWSITPNLGAISATGLYTAPKRHAGATIVVVTARSRSNNALTGGALLLVYQPAASTGVAVSPDVARVTAGQSIELTTTDPANNPIDVKWSLSPDVGHIQAGWSHGKYTYTAPDTIARAVSIKATATDAKTPSRTGVASISLAPTVKVSVSPPSSDVKFGGALELKATAAGVDPDHFRWAVFPVGAGVVEPHDDASRATYRAPASSKDTDVKVIAYKVDDDAAVGLGSANVNLIP